MKKVFMALLAGVILLSACSTIEDIEVHQAWSRPTPQGDTAAAYFELHNHTQTDDELIGASSTISDSVEIHESKMENDVMTMNMLSSISLPAGEELTFEPGGLHIMLIGIKQELKKGGKYELVLHFKNHADITVNVTVDDQPAMDDMEDMHDQSE
jgi:copper(I)-binding protein